MRTLPFALIVLLYLPSSLAGQVEDEPKEEEVTLKDVILDVAQPNPQYVDEFTRSPYGVVTKVYRAKNGYYITSIVEKSEPIWEDPNHSCTHVNVLTHGDDNHVNIYVRDEQGTRKPLYYAKDEEEDDWAPIEESTFYSTFHQRVVKESYLESIDLDISQKKTCEKFFVTDTPKLPFLLFSPNVNYRIKSVKNGKALWEAASDEERCMYASFYPRDGPTLAYLVVHTSEGLKELYYSKNGNSWTSVEKDVYLKRLAEAGFDESTFDNTIILDLSSVDKETFYTSAYPLDDYGVDVHMPFVGFRLRTIVDNDKEVWKAEEGSNARCAYTNAVHMNGSIFALFIFVEDPEGDRKVLYFIKRDDKWSKVAKEDYYTYLVEKNGMALELPKMENQRITMSSFRNKQGLKIITYASEVNNSRGDIILIHGIRSHFKSEFCASDTEWNYERFGFPISPDMNGIFLRESKHKRNLVEMYRHLFEHVFTDEMNGMDAFEVSPRYEYSHSLVEFFNKLGYNVYGMDLQAHGLSEAGSTTRCHAENFIDFAYDVMQFVSIVRRGKFSDVSQVWDEQTILQSLPTSRKLFLLGHSMGGNIVMQAVQEFHRMAESSEVTSGRPIVDGLISTAGMFSLDNHADTTVKKAAKSFLNIASRAAPNKANPYDKVINYGESFDLFVRYRDPFFFSGKLTLKTTSALLVACTDVNKAENMAHYPKDLPILFIHTDKDFMCDSKGPKEMVNTHLRGSSGAKLVEFKGETHFLTVPHSILLSQKHLKEWLDKHTNV